MNYRTSPSWYDILGVRRDASPGEIKAAWRDATDKFEPGSGSGQFRLFNEAADVLLDPGRRQEYDAQLAAEEGSDEASSPGRREAGRPEQAADSDGDGATTQAQPAGGASTAAAGGVAGAAGAAEARRERKRADKPWLRGDRRREPRSSASRSGRERAAGSQAGLRIGWIPLGVLALLLAVVLAVGLVLWQKNRAFSADQEAGMEAGSAAEHAVPAVLSYDYRHLDTDERNALKFLTPRFQYEFRKTYRLLRGTAANPGAALQTRAVVVATSAGSGVASATADRADIVLFVNQTTSRAGGQPRTSLNRLKVSMVHSKQDNNWLLDDIKSY